VFKGLGVTKDEAEGVKLLQKSCDAKEKFGCDKLKEAAKKTPGAKPAP
jgi:hypothetical protein